MKKTYYVICMDNGFLGISQNHHGINFQVNSYGDPCSTDDLNYTKLWHDEQSAKHFISSRAKLETLNLFVKQIVFVIE